MGHLTNPLSLRLGLNCFWVSSQVNIKNKDLNFYFLQDFFFKEIIFWFFKKIKKKGYLYSHFKLYKKKNNIYFLLFYYNLKIII